MHSHSFSIDCLASAKESSGREALHFYSPAAEDLFVSPASASSSSAAAAASASSCPGARFALPSAAREHERERQSLFSLVSETSVSLTPFRSPRPPLSPSSSLQKKLTPSRQLQQFNLAHKKTPNDIWAALEAACPSEGDGSIVAAVAAGDGGADASSSSTSAAAGGGGGGKASKHKWKKPASSSSPPTPNRRVRIGPGAHNPAAAGNAVKTAKYNPVTFLPLFLFSMFSRAAYLYFLSQAALAWWSTVSPFAPFGPTLALSFVLAVAALKAAAEDRTRAAEDRRTNGSPARVVLPDGSLLETRWRHVKVGDVLEVRDGVR